MMRSLISSAFLLLFWVPIPLFAVPFKGVSRASTPFGIPRGGGLFGKKDDDSAVKDEASDEKKSYPAMTQDEVKEWLEHIPVFAVTDLQGSGVVLKPDNDSSVFYFFMSPVQANATLNQLKGSNEEMELRVSAFSLGKVWFDLIHGDPNKEVVLKSPTGGDADPAKGVEYRLVPDTRDLLGARMLLTMTPEDGEKMKENGMTQEMAQAALQKAMGSSPKFNSTFNEIPVFTIAQMRMQRQVEEGETGEPITLLPMYFSLQSMVGTWQKFMSSAPADIQSVEPAINLLSLHEVVDMLQQESEIDWRNVVLVPSTPLGAGGEPSDADNSASISSADTMAQMGGATLGDL